MKALSLKEPWAGMVVEGVKTLELRTWRTRHRGPMIIHRSGRGGGIIGTVEVREIMEITCFEQFRALREQHRAPDEFYGLRLYGWVLEGPRPLPFIPCKGRLGLWEVPPEMEQEIKGSKTWRQGSEFRFKV